jgi:tRNA(Ile)-lysidine synthase TilS/MesJ
MDGSETSSIKETMEIKLECHFSEDSEEGEIQHHKNVRKYIEEPTNTNEDVEFSQAEIKQTIEGFSDKKAPGIDGITGGIYQRAYKIFPRTITAIYNQCLKRGCFP